MSRRGQGWPRPAGISGAGCCQDLQPRSAEGFTFFLLVSGAEPLAKPPGSLCLVLVLSHRPGFSTCALESTPDVNSGIACKRSCPSRNRGRALAAVLQQAQPLGRDAGASPSSAGAAGLLEAHLGASPAALPWPNRRQEMQEVPSPRGNALGSSASTCSTIRGAGSGWGGRLGAEEEDGGWEMPGAWTTRERGHFLSTAFSQNNSLPLSPPATPLALPWPQPLLMFNPPDRTAGWGCHKGGVTRRRCHRGGDTSWHRGGTCVPAAVSRHLRKPPG